jgi:hypothetical protein
MKVICARGINQNEIFVFKISTYYIMNTVFWQVMAFYALLSCVIMPLIGYYFKGEAGLGQGYIIGSLVSVGLWLMVGKKYANM